MLSATNLRLVGQVIRGQTPLVTGYEAVAVSAQQRRGNLSLDTNHSVSKFIEEM